MKFFHTLTPVGKILMAACAASTAVTLISGPASASTPGGTALLYDYQFANSTGTVANSAPDGPDVPLTLTGTTGAWTSGPNGVKFTGNTTSSESVAYGQVAGGDTIDEPATAAIGFGARFVYEQPTSGECFSNGPNVTQIGLYAAKPVPAQLKLQLSDCQTSSTQVMAQCRFAGSLTTGTTDTPVTSTLPLVNNTEYNMSCIKSADHAGMATITINVTPVKTGMTTTNTFSVSAIGYIKSKQYISAANIYPLPAQADNTNQLNATINRAVYCAGTGTQVTACLTANLTGK
jgi:hypothetical protein